MYAYAGYEDVASWPDLEPVEMAICAEMDDKDVRIVGQGITDLIHQFTGTRQSLRFESDPPPQTYPSDVCLVVTGAPSALTEPLRVRTISIHPASSVAGEEVLDAIGDGFAQWLEFNDDYLMMQGVITSPHTVDYSTIAVVDDGNEMVHAEVNIHPPAGGIASPSVVTEGPPEEVVNGNGDIVPAVVEPEKKPIWPYFVAGGAALVLAVGVGAVIIMKE